MYGPRRDVKERGWRCWFPSRLSWLKWYSMAGQVKNYNREQWSRGSEAQTWTSWNGCTSESPSHASESESRVIDHRSSQPRPRHSRTWTNAAQDATRCHYAGYWQFRTCEMVTTTRRDSRQKPMLLTIIVFQTVEEAAIWLVGCCRKLAIRLVALLNS